MNIAVVGLIETTFERYQFDVSLHLIPAEIDGEEYLAGAVDPIAQFTAPIAVHMIMLRLS